MTAVRTPRQIRLLTALLLFGTFLLGAVAGAGLSQWNRMPFPRPPRPAPFLPGPPGALNLTPEQEAKAREITERYRPELEAVLRENFPKVRAINERMEMELREILAPEQRKLLDEMKAHRPSMPFAGGMMPPGGPPPGPPPGLPLGAGPPGGGPPFWPHGPVPSAPPAGNPPPAAPEETQQ